jgi:hypothetical protein
MGVQELLGNNGVYVPGRLCGGGTRALRKIVSLIKWVCC